MEMLINGKYVTSDEKIDVYNPYSNEIIDNIPHANKLDVEYAIQSAYLAKNEIQKLSSRKISEALYDATEELKKQKEDFSKLITLETGKPLKDSYGEMNRSIDTLLLSAEESKRIYGETVPLDAGIGGNNIIGFTMRLPLGVIGTITPFNYPVNLAIHKIAPAIASKNTVISKPSVLAPLSCLKLIEIFDSVLPDGCVNSVTGPGSSIGDLITTSPLIDKISFTGSVNVGREISQKAVMKKVTLELGGNDPFIVLSDADLESAVKSAVMGAYLIAGQVCIGVKRIIVEEDIADEFVDLLSKSTEKLVLGNPLDEKTDIGPLINESATKYVENLVERAVNSGAELICGGNHKNNLFEPTVLDNVNMKMDIVKNETFGPVAPVIRVKDIDEAINVANNSNYGLQSCVFTENIHNAIKVANCVEAGSVLINKVNTFRTDNMPFGGFKMSGMGKEGVKYAIEDMTRIKLIAFNK